MGILPLPYSERIDAINDLLDGFIKLDGGMPQAVTLANIAVSGSASDLTSGTLSDARLSSNVPLKNAASNAFTGSVSLGGTLSMSTGANTFSTFMGGPGNYEGMQHFQTNGQTNFWVYSGGTVSRSTVQMLGDDVALRAFDTAASYVRFYGTGKSDCEVAGGTTIRFIAGGASRATINATAAQFTVPIQLGSGGPSIQQESGVISFRSGAGAYTQVRATEYRLDANSFSRVAQLNTATGGWGGGYNFNVTGGTFNRDSTGTVNAVYYNVGAIQWFSSSSGAPGVIPVRMELTPSYLRYITEAGSQITIAGTDIAGGASYMYLTSGSSHLYLRTNAASNIPLLLVNATCQFAANQWHGDQVNTQRIYFTGNGSTSYKGYGSLPHRWTNSAGTQIMSISDVGALSVLGNVTATGRVNSGNGTSFGESGVGNSIRGDRTYIFSASGAPFGDFNQSLAEFKWGFTPNHGAVSLQAIDAVNNRTGYLAWFKPSGTRQGYIGYDDGNDITLKLEQAGGQFVVDGVGARIGSSGPLLKNNSGTLQVRNSADSAFANVRVNQLQTESTSTFGGVILANLGIRVSGDSGIQYANQTPTSTSAGTWAWIDYTANSNILYRRDVINSRNQVIYTGGASNDAALVEFNSRLIVASHITSAFQTLSADPSTLDISSGMSRLVKNTTSGEIRHWVNDGGTMKKSAAFT